MGWEGGRAGKALEDDLFYRCDYTTGTPSLVSERLCLSTVG